MNKQSTVMLILAPNYGARGNCLKHIFQNRICESLAMWNEMFFFDVGFLQKKQVDHQTHLNSYHIWP